MRMLFTLIKRRCFWCEESGQKEKKRQITRLAIGIQFRGKKLFLAISHQYHLHPPHFVQRVICGVGLPRWFVCKIEAFYIPEKNKWNMFKTLSTTKLCLGQNPLLGINQKFCHFFRDFMSSGLVNGIQMPKNRWYCNYKCYEGQNGHWMSKTDELSNSISRSRHALHCRWKCKLFRRTFLALECFQTFSWELYWVKFPCVANIGFFGVFSEQED